MVDASASSLDWDVILKAAGIIAPAIGWFAGRVGVRLGRRATISADLDILEKIADGKIVEETHEQLIKQRIEANLTRLYGASQVGEWITTKTVSFALIGSVWSLIFGYLTVMKLFDREWNFTWSWWALLTGYLTLIPISMFYASYEGKFRDRVKSKESESTS